MNNSIWVLSIVLFGAILSLFALFSVWRKFGGSLISDGLPDSVQLVITQIRTDYENKIAAIKTACDMEVAEIRCLYEIRLAEQTRQLVELHRQVEWLLAQLLAAGGKAMPIMIPQPSEKRTVVILGLWPVAVDIASREEIDAISRSGILYVPMDGRVTKRTVVAAIENEKPTILHFGGHSTEEFTEFDDGSADIGWWKNLVQEFPIIKVVFLNSCSSLSIVDAMASAGVVAVVGMRGEIADSVAIDFARDFYERLSAGRSVSDAGRLARSGLARTDAELIAVRDPSNWRIEKG